MFLFSRLLNFSLAVFAAVMLIVASSGCNDDCKNVECKNNGICVEGTCDCAMNYEGDDCGKLVRDRYLGNYNVLDTCLGGTATLNAHVAEDTIISSVVLSFDLSPQPYTVHGSIDGNTISVKEQHFFNTTFVKGNGTFNPADNSFTLFYTTHDTALNVRDTCSSKWIRL